MWTRDHVDFGTSGLGDNVDFGTCGIGWNWGVANSEPCGLGSAPKGLVSSA